MINSHKTTKRLKIQVLIVFWSVTRHKVQNLQSLIALFVFRSRWFSKFTGGGYEVYDPYTGNVTVLMGPPPGHYPPVGHPMLAAMSYQPMPLQPVDWYNPSNPSANEHWIPGGAVYQPNSRHHKKSTSDAHQVSAFELIRTQCPKIIIFIKS